MLTLMQILKLFNKADREELKYFFEFAEDDITEIDELAIVLDNSGIELTDRQIDALKGLVIRGTWESGFKTIELMG